MNATTSSILVIVLGGLVPAGCIAKLELDPSTSTSASTGSGSGASDTSWVGASSGTGGWDPSGGIEPTGGSPPGESSDACGSGGSMPDLGFPPTRYCLPSPELDPEVIGSFDFGFEVRHALWTWEQCCTPRLSLYLFPELSPSVFDIVLPPYAVFDIDDAYVPPYAGTVHGTLTFVTETGSESFGARIEIVASLTDDPPTEEGSLLVTGIILDAIPETTVGPLSAGFCRDLAGPPPCLCE